jgi:hypothetical protein
MENNNYNWRANRATRLVGMRYNPETLEDVEFAKQDIEDKYEEMDWFMKDLIDISQIDWEEIEENIRKELELENQ